jgi:outer membrane biosynthesis protein TonB/ribosomal protein L40E
VHDSHCAACGKGLSLQDIERGGFQHIGGRLYCAGCVGKMRRVGPRLCPECQSMDTPLYTGKGYVCRKCGAEIKPDAAAKTAPKERGTPKAKPAAKTASRSEPKKKCPYCGAILPAEALKCRYCGSHLTREARDLESIDAQLHRLRFWLGCFLTATVLLLAFGVYAITRPADGNAQATAPPQPSAKVAALQKQMDTLASQKQEAEDRVAALEQQVERLNAYIDRMEARNPAITAPPEPEPPKKKPAPKAKREPAPPQPKSKAPTKAAPEPPEKKAPAPPPTPKKGPAKSKEDAQAAKARAAARAAAEKAYAEFTKDLVQLRAAHAYGEAIAACRQFIGAHLGTPQAELVKKQQENIQAKVESIREVHTERFRAALEKNDFDAARRVIAELSRYQAPEIAQDRKYMTAEVKKAQAQPDRAMAAYLHQWEVPTHVARLVRQLRPNQEGDWTPRADAAQQLGRIGHRSAIAGLLDALHDPEWFVVSNALEALVAIGDPIALPYVVPLTKASHPGIYDTAARACRALAQAPRDKFAEAWKLLDKKALAKSILEALRQGGKEESEVTSRFQIALVETLAHLGVKGAADELPKAVQSSDPAVKKAVAAAVQTLSGTAPETPKPKAKGEPKGKAEPAPKPAPKEPKSPEPPAKTKPAPKKKSEPTPRPAPAGKANT